MSVLITSEDKTTLQTTYHIPINGQGENKYDWLIIDDSEGQIHITIKNENTGKNAKQYYYAEIFKGSQFYDVVRGVLKMVENNK